MEFRKVMKELMTPEDPVCSTIHSKIAAVLAGSDIGIVCVQHHQYQEAYTFKRLQEVVRINVFYNAKGTITKFGAARQTPLARHLLTLLAGIEKEQPTREAIGKSLFPAEGLYAFYLLLKEETAKRAITIARIENIQFGQRYFFLRRQERACVIFWYNAKYRLTTTQFVSQNPESSALGQELCEIFTTFAS